MDALRRVARGRLAELVGDQPFLHGSSVDFDLSMRGWGIDAAAERDAAGLDPESRRLLRAFVDGINWGRLRGPPLRLRRRHRWWGARLSRLYWGQFHSDSA